MVVASTGVVLRGEQCRDEELLLRVSAYGGVIGRHDGVFQGFAVGRLRVVVHHAAHGVDVYGLHGVALLGGVEQCQCLCRPCHA